MNIIRFEILDSTNTYAKKNIEQLEDRTVISTDVQTGGYGRFDRVWVDLGAENIYMSFVLKPSETLCQTHANLTQYLSVCLCEVIENMFTTNSPQPSHCSGEGVSANPLIKWPNDVLLNGKKVCGILAESVIKGGKLKGIVLGIGVNLNASFEHLNEIDRPATSLNLELGSSVNKIEFMQKLIDRFYLNYDEFLKNGFVMIKEKYENRNILQAEAGKIKLAVFNLIKDGEFTGFDNNGNLLLLNKNGEIEHINMGELVS